MAQDWDVTFLYLVSWAAPEAAWVGVPGGTQVGRAPCEGLVGHVRFLLISECGPRFSVYERI